jgi:multiple antibiotic resistance protein
MLRPSIVFATDDCWAKSHIFITKTSKVARQAGCRMDLFLYYLITNIITLFVVVNPIAVIPFFQGLTAAGTDEQRKAIVKRASVVVVVILLFFASLGDLVLTILGITLHYIMIAGGIYILVFAVKNALGGGGDQASQSRGSGKNAHGLPKAVAERIAIVPIGTPLLAGPGSIATAMILNDDPTGVTTTVIAILVNALLAWLILRLSSKLVRVVSPSVLMVLGTVMNILMAAIGVAFLLKGISAAYSIKFI